MESLKNDLRKVITANKRLEEEKNKLKEDKSKLINEVIMPLKEKIRMLKQELTKEKMENEENREQFKEIEDRKNILDVKEEVFKDIQKKWEEEQEYEKLLMDEEWFNIQKANGLEEPNDYEQENIEAEGTSNELKENSVTKEERELLDEIVEKYKKKETPIEPPPKKKRGRKPKTSFEETPSKKPRLEKAPTPRRSPRLEKQNLPVISPKQEPTWELPIAESSVRSEQENSVKEEAIEDFPILIPQLDLETPVTRGGYYLQSQRELDHVQQWRQKFGEYVLKALKKYLLKIDKPMEFTEEIVCKFFDRLTNNLLDIHLTDNDNLLDIHLTDFKKEARYIANNICIFFPVKGHVRNHLSANHKNIKDKQEQELVKNFTDDFVNRIIDSYIGISQDKMLQEIKFTDDHKLMIQNEIDWFLSRNV